MGKEDLGAAKETMIKIHESLEDSIDYIKIMCWNGREDLTSKHKDNSGHY